MRLIRPLLIFSILAVVFVRVVPQFVGRKGSSESAHAEGELHTIKNLLQHFKFDCDLYPTTDEGLAALHTAPSGLEGKWGLARTPTRGPSTTPGVTLTSTGPTEGVTF